MPRIQWSGLPPALRDHLFDRLRDRKITAEDLYQLKAWRESNPEAPEGLWYKDFGSFKICGDGPCPKTFLLAAKPPKGRNSDVPGWIADGEHALRRWPTRRFCAVDSVDEFHYADRR